MPAHSSLVEHFALMLQRHPVIFFHLVTAVLALLLGAIMFAWRKGTRSHKAWGWTLVVLMGSTALASAFIRDYNMPNLAGITPIHAFTVITAANLPRGIWYIRRGNVAAHRRCMTNLYVGACLLAGAFTLLPGRFLGHLLWHHAFGVVA